MKRIISLILVLSLVLSFSSFALADNTVTSNGESDPTTTVIYQGKSVSDASYMITVPSLLSPGDSGSVLLEGSWPSSMTVNVTADETVKLTNSIDNKTKTLTVTFNGISQVGNNTSPITDVIEPVSVENISNALFGVWSGHFNYNVDYVPFAKAENNVGFNVEKDLSLKAGEKQVVTVTREGTGEITASSSNEDVATAEVKDDEVTIEGVGKGEATITIAVAEDDDYAEVVEEINVEVTAITNPLEDLQWGETLRFGIYNAGSDSVKASVTDGYEIEWVKATDNIAVIKTRPQSKVSWKNLKDWGFMGDGTECVINGIPCTIRVQTGGLQVGSNDTNYGGEDKSIVDPLRKAGKLNGIGPGDSIWTNGYVSNHYGLGFDLFLVVYEYNTVSSGIVNADAGTGGISNRFYSFRLLLIFDD